MNNTNQDIQIYFPKHQCVIRIHTQSNIENRHNDLNNWDSGKFDKKDKKVFLKKETPFLNERTRRFKKIRFVIYEPLKKIKIEGK